MSAILLAAVVLVATVMQAHEALLQLREHEALPAFQAVDELNTEVSRWRLVRRRRHRRLVKALLAESPAEASAYRRLRRVLLSWALLAGAALSALLVAVVSSP